MTTSTPRRHGRMPVDPAARERLREAQAAESSAVAGYFAAVDHVRAREANLAEAEKQLADAAVTVVDISGSERAMTLLGLKKAELRTIVASKSAS